MNETFELLVMYLKLPFVRYALIVGVLGCPNTRGKSLAQITRERYGEDI